MYADVCVYVCGDLCVYVVYVQYVCSFLYAFGYHVSGACVNVHICIYLIVRSPAAVVLFI